VSLLDHARIVVSLSGRRRAFDAPSPRLQDLLERNALPEEPE
jgi:hypothetical protein